MANGVFNIAKGAVAEKIRDATTNVLVLCLQTNEAESTLVDHDTVASMLTTGGSPSPNVEADFTNYARKTGITGTVTVDDSNDRVDVSIPDQTFTSAGGATNNTLTKVIVAYDETGGSPMVDGTVIPMTHHDFAVTTDGNDLIADVGVDGIYRAS